jgi:hypothetical protein
MCFQNGLCFMELAQRQNDRPAEYSHEITILI